jgi:hypothetical protein
MVDATETAGSVQQRCRQALCGSPAVTRSSSKCVDDNGNPATGQVTIMSAASAVNTKRSVVSGYAVPSGHHRALQHTPLASTIATAPRSSISSLEEGPIAVAAILSASPWMMASSSRFVHTDSTSPGARTSSRHGVATSHAPIAPWPSPRSYETALTRNQLSANVRSSCGSDATASATPPDGAPVKNSESGCRLIGVASKCTWVALLSHKTRFAKSCPGASRHVSNQRHARVRRPYPRTQA